LNAQTHLVVVIKRNGHFDVFNVAALGFAGGFGVPAAALAAAPAAAAAAAAAASPPCALKRVGPGRRQRQRAPLVESGVQAVVYDARAVHLHFRAASASAASGREHRVRVRLALEVGVQQAPRAAQPHPQRPAHGGGLGGALHLGPPR
jgi:hypothetical protein